VISLRAVAPRTRRRVRHGHEYIIDHLGGDIFVWRIRLLWAGSLVLNRPLASARSDLLSRSPPYIGDSHEGPSVSAMLATETKFREPCGVSFLGFGGALWNTAVLSPRFLAAFLVSGVESAILVGGPQHSTVRSAGTLSDQIRVRHQAEGTFLSRENWRAKFARRGDPAHV
jgi:hypothetical protein